MKHTINGLSEQTGIDRRTIKRKLGKAGMTEGREEWTLPEVLPVLFADGEPSTYAENRNRLVLAQARKVELENQASERILIPTELVQKVWNRTTSEYRRRVLEADLSIQLRKELLEMLEPATIDEYFNTDTPTDSNQGSNEK